jgi:ABC-type proline/glycine betaine transport system ATPase subunit
MKEGDVVFCIDNKSLQNYNLIALSYNKGYIIQPSAY